MKDVVDAHRFGEFEAIGAPTDWGQYLERAELLVVELLGRTLCPNVGSVEPHESTWLVVDCDVSVLISLVLLLCLVQDGGSLELSQHVIHVFGEHRGIIHQTLAHGRHWRAVVSSIGGSRARALRVPEVHSRVSAVVGEERCHASRGVDMVVEGELGCR